MVSFVLSRGNEHMGGSYLQSSATRKGKGKLCEREEILHWPGEEKLSWLGAFLKVALILMGTFTVWKMGGVANFIPSNFPCKNVPCSQSAIFWTTTIPIVTSWVLD